MTVADIFDALIHDRPYKHAWPVDRAVAEITAQRGRQFDPAVVDAFPGLAEQGAVPAVPAVAHPSRRRRPAGPSRK